MPQPAPKIGIVSLGCPKALVDSERIVSHLQAEGYELSATYDGAEAVIVNTCGFLDSAKKESLDAIGEALSENGKVIVTGCMGANEDGIREVHPGVLSVSGPQQYETVVSAVHEVVKPVHDPYMDLLPPGGLKMTPRHYAYLKIAEGCNQTCSFCIIPSMRGKLRSRPAGDIVKEAEQLAIAGVKELLIVSQDTGAYGVDIKHAESDFYGTPVRAHINDLCTELGKLGIWVRLHYVYPYPHIDKLVPLMGDGTILPYLDIPFQHADPAVLKNMRRPGNIDKTLERVQKWRAMVPDLTIRSTFIVGFPGETEEQFENLLDFVEEAELDRVGCFKYEPVDGAKANDLPDPVDDEVKEERWHRFMEVQRQVSEKRMSAKIGKSMTVLVDEVDEEGAIARSMADAPEIDGNVFLNGETDVAVGDFVEVTVEHADEYDLWATKN